MIDPISRNKIGDKVVLDFYCSGEVVGIVSGVKYTDYGKVLYDITITPFENENNNRKMKFKLKDIDSYFVKPCSDKFFKDKTMPLN